FPCRALFFLLTHSPATPYLHLSLHDALPISYRHAGPAVAHLETEHGVTGFRKRRHQLGEILLRLGKTELGHRACHPREVAVQERDASVAHPHGFDEPVPRLVHATKAQVASRKAQERALATCALRLVPGRYGQLDLLRPFRERSIIHAHPREAEQGVQREIHVARLEAAVTVGDDRLVGRDSP